jgi:hypothetical protein
MRSTLTVNEKYSQYWPAIAIMSAVLALGFYIFYHFSSDVLIGGYLRLTAFGFFAVAVLSFFKVKDGKMKISISHQDQIIEIIYTLRNRVVHEEEINLNDVEAIKTDAMPDRSLYNNFKRSDRCIRFKRKDSEFWIYFNEIHGRVIPLSRENAETMVNYIEKLRA